MKGIITPLYFALSCLWEKRYYTFYKGVITPFYVITPFEKRYNAFLCLKGIITPFHFSSLCLFHVITPSKKALLCLWFGFRTFLFAILNVLFSGCTNIAANVLNLHWSRMLSIFPTDENFLTFKEHNYIIIKSVHQRFFNYTTQYYRTYITSYTEHISVYCSTSQDI